MKNTFNRRPFLVTPVMEERIIAVAYDEGGFWDRFVVHFTRKNNPKVQALYESHLQVIAESQEEFSKITCPRNLESRLLAISEEVESETSILDGFIQLVGGLRAVGAVAAVFVLSAFVITGVHQRQQQMELAEATLQAKETLALVSSIMNGSTKGLHDEILVAQTARPLRNSIYKGTESIKRNL